MFVTQLLHFCMNPDLLRNSGGKGSTYLELEVQNTVSHKCLRNLKQEGGEIGWRWQGRNKITSSLSSAALPGSCENWGGGNRLE
jgi:hypothetical protein